MKKLLRFFKGSYGAASTGFGGSAAGLIAVDTADSRRERMIHE
jgi:hypothetical protein